MRDGSSSFILHPSSLRVVEVRRVSGRERACAQDVVAVEGPLEIRVAYGPAGRREVRVVAVTMRTPGADADLAGGFVFTEGIVGSADQVAGITCDEAGNRVCVELAEGVPVDLDRLERLFYMSSSCGVCGKRTIDAVCTSLRHGLPAGAPLVSAEVVHRLPEALRAAQAVFERTGGLHAAALFDAAGALRGVREDVGRHNALDKLIGAELMAGRVPLGDGVVLVSGRASFELVQKAAVAGAPVLAAVGAPSSLAVELARESGMTLLGFVRAGRFNVYCGDERIRWNE